MPNLTSFYEVKHEFHLFYIEGWIGQKLGVPLKSMCTIKALLELIKVLSLTKCGTWNLMNHSVFSIPNPILHTVWSKYSTLLLSGLDFLLDFLSRSQVPQEEVSYMEKEKVWPWHAMLCNVSKSTYPETDDTVWWLSYIDTCIHLRELLTLLMKMPSELCLL